jgi:hypothetical protein
VNVSDITVKPEFAFSVGGVIAAVSAAWATAKNLGRSAHARIKRVEEWKDKHETDSTNLRVQIAGSLGEIKTAIAAQNATQAAQNAEILRRLDSFDTRLDKKQDRASHRQI